MDIYCPTILFMIMIYILITIAIGLQYTDHSLSPLLEVSLHLEASHI